MLLCTLAATVPLFTRLLLPLLLQYRSPLLLSLRPSMRRQFLLSGQRRTLLLLRPLWRLLLPKSHRLQLWRRPLSLLPLTCPLLRLLQSSSFPRLLPLCPLPRRPL